ncbi:hypothetical protein BC826DRAFT_574917 [Russula brevipes]|nr:hypothetical protein BC826DRAFT_574917 [Russula brevipes]
MNKSKRRSSPMSPLPNENAEIVWRVTSWHSPPDPWKHQNGISKLRHPGTAAWFVDGETSSNWKGSEQSSLHWIHGKRSLLYLFVAPVACALRSLLALSLFLQSLTFLSRLALSFSLSLSPRTHPRAFACFNDMGLLTIATTCNAVMNQIQRSYQNHRTSPLSPSIGTGRSP